ncbi:NUDIX hydrolase [Nocardioides dongkuii]|uniref:NUDIX hydrolase n=1 Tax=Nocardioides dongkuii TaxID=2760089 RepID=UPI001C70AE7F|nr:NUDIX domain-containing protein [Nocardioides dongkuii]
MTDAPHDLPHRLPHYTEYDTRLGAYAVIRDEEGRLLLALWNEPDHAQWTLPGGGVELPETVEEGAVREVREETGYDVRLDRLLAVDSHVVPAERRLHGGPPGRALKSVRVLFAATVVGGTLTAEVDGSTDEARWFPVEEVPGLQHVSLVDVALRHLG